MPQRIENLHLVIGEMIKFWKKEFILLNKGGQEENTKLKLIKEKPKGFVEDIIKIIEKQVRENKKEIRIEKKLKRDTLRVKNIIDDCIKNESSEVRKRLEEIGLAYDKQDLTILNTLIQLSIKRKKNLKDQESKLENLKSSKSIGIIEKEINEENAILNEINAFWQKEKEGLGKLGLISEKMGGAKSPVAKALSKKPATAIIIIIILAIALGGGGLFVKNKFFLSEAEKAYEEGTKKGIEQLNDMIMNRLNDVKKAVAEIDGIKATTEIEYDDIINKYTDQLHKLEDIQVTYDFQLSGTPIKDSVQRAYENEKKVIISKIDEQYLGKLKLIINFIKAADSTEDFTKKYELYSQALRKLYNNLMGLSTIEESSSKTTKAYSDEIGKLKAKMAAISSIPK